MAVELEEHFKSPEWVSQLENKHKRVCIYILNLVDDLLETLNIGIVLTNIYI